MVPYPWPPNLCYDCVYVSDLVFIPPVHTPGGCGLCSVDSDGSARPTATGRATDDGADGSGAGCQPEPAHLDASRARTSERRQLSYGGGKGDGSADRNALDTDENADPTNSDADRAHADGHTLGAQHPHPPAH